MRISRSITILTLDAVVECHFLSCEWICSNACTPFIRGGFQDAADGRSRESFPADQHRHILFHQHQLEAQHVRPDFRDLDLRVVGSSIKLTATY